MANDVSSLSGILRSVCSCSVAKWLILVCSNKYKDKNHCHTSTHTHTHAAYVKCVWCIEYSNLFYLFTHLSVALQTNSRSHKHSKDSYEIVLCLPLVFSLLLFLRLIYGYWSVLSYISFYEQPWDGNCWKCDKRTSTITPFARRSLWECVYQTITTTTPTNKSASLSAVLPIFQVLKITKIHWSICSACNLSTSKFLWILKIKTKSHSFFFLLSSDTIFLRFIHTCFSFRSKFRFNNFINKL